MGPNALRIVLVRIAFAKDDPSPSTDDMYLDCRFTLVEMKLKKRSQITFSTQWHGTCGALIPSAGSVRVVACDTMVMTVKRGAKKRSTVQARQRGGKHGAVFSARDSNVSTNSI